MEEIVTNTEATIPEEEVTETATEPTETEVSEEGTEGTEAEEANTEPETEPAEEFTIRYKHEDVKLARDEVKRLAQLGKHYEESEKKVLDDLDYIATLRGTTVKDLVKGLVEMDDDEYKRELVAQFGEENEMVKDMLELRQKKNRKAYDEAVSNRAEAERRAEEEAQKSATTKLAEQFEAVREAFPEFDTVEKVPDTVIKKALQSGDLEKEILRYKLSEGQKIEAAKASQEKNKNQNVGSVASDGTDDGISSAFMKGLWG